MSDYLPYLVIGVATGAVYAIASMGLVVTYTTSGVFNFAHGAVGMFSAYIFYTLRTDVGVPTILAAAVVVVLVAPAVGVVLDRVLLARFSGSSPAANIVLSLGLLVALQGGISAVYGAQTRQFDPLFPTTTALRIAGVNVGVDQFWVLGIAIVGGIALYLFFSRTQLGLATQAVVGDRDLTLLVGVDARAVTTFSWMLGCSFAAVAGILFSPVVGLDSLVLTLLVVQAFGAAVVGRLRSLPLTNVGAYGIAIAAALVTKVVATHPTLRGLPTALPFIVLFLVLVASPRGAFRNLDDQRVPGFRFGTRPPFELVAAFSAIALLLPVVLGDGAVLTATATAAFAMVFASLGLLVGLSRQVSLCHAAFVALGATTLSHLLEAGLPYGPALVLAGLTVVPIGAFIAIPAIRLSGLFLALATFGFGVLTEALLFGTSLVFGDTGTVSVARPSLFRGDTAFYYFVVAVVVAGVLGLEVVKVTRLGRILRGIADSPVAVQAIRINPTAAKVMVFCLSAFVAAIAGGLLGSLIGNVTLMSFSSFQSLTWLAVLVTAGAATMTGSVLAAVLLVATPAFITSAAFADWQAVAFGIGAILYAQRPNGIAGQLQYSGPALPELAERSRARLARTRHAERLAALRAGTGL